MRGNPHDRPVYTPLYPPLTHLSRGVTYFLISKYVETYGRLCYTISGKSEQRKWRVGFLREEVRAMRKFDWRVELLMFIVRYMILWTIFEQLSSIN